jgi:hypothetical protein
VILTAVGSAAVAGALALYGELLQQIGVRARERFVVRIGGEQRTVDSSTVQYLCLPPKPGPPILAIRVRNRGRRPVQIRTVGQAYWFRVDGAIFDEPFRELPVTIQPGRAHEFLIGGVRPYEHTGRPVRRVYVVDGGDRIHPLRERWLRRVENVLYRWPVVRYRKLRGRPQYSNLLTDEPPS